LVVRFGLTRALLALAILCLAAGITSALLLRELPGHGEATQPSRTPLRDGRTWRLKAVGSLLVLIQYSLLSFLVIYLHEEWQFKAALADGALAIVQLSL
jgi:hypothetical protein